MKRISFLLGWLFISILSFGQFPSNRAPASITVRDARIQGYLNLFIPVYADTATANINIGLDSLGALIQIRSSGNIYHRDTSAGTHKWTLIAASSPPSAAWGSITGTLSAQTDLQTALNGKQATIGLGTTTQYFRGDLSLATFPTTLSFFTNDPLFISSVTSQYSIQGTGLAGSPLQLIGDVPGPGVNKYYGTNGGGTRGWYTNASALSFISGSGTTLAGDGNPGTPYRYDFDGFLTHSTHISGSDLYDMIWDSVQNFKIVDHDGNYSLFGSQNHNFQILGGPVAGSQHGSDLFDIFSANTANDHSSRLKMYPDSVELSFQSAGATGGWISKADGTLRFKGLTQTSNDTTANKVLVYNPADKKVHYANYASTGSGTGITQPFRDTVNNKLDSIYRKPGSDSVFKCRYNVCTFAYRDSIGGSSGNFIGRDSVLTITSGTSSTVTNGYNIVRFNPASVMATYSLTLPTTYHTSNKILLVFDADAITDGSPVITNLTIIAGSGRTLRQRVIPITADAGETISYHLIGTHDQRTGE